MLAGAALYWRRCRPALVMGIALAGGVGTHLLAPEGLSAYAGYFAIYALAVARPPRVSLPVLGPAARPHGAELLHLATERRGDRDGRGRRRLGLRGGDAQSACDRAGRPAPGGGR
jgi:hypothetical protein